VASYQPDYVPYTRQSGIVVAPPGAVPVRPHEKPARHQQSAFELDAQRSLSLHPEASSDAIEYAYRGGLISKAVYEERMSIAPDRQHSLGSMESISMSQMHDLLDLIEQRLAQEGSNYFGDDMRNMRNIASKDHLTLRMAFQPGDWAALENYEVTAEVIISAAIERLAVPYRGPLVEDRSIPAFTMQPTRERQGLIPPKGYTQPKVEPKYEPSPGSPSGGSGQAYTAQPVGPQTQSPHAASASSGADAVPKAVAPTEYTDVDEVPNAMPRDEPWKGTPTTEDVRKIPGHPLCEPLYAPTDRSRHAQKHNEYASIGGLFDTVEQDGERLRRFQEMQFNVLMAQRSKAAANFQARGLSPADVEQALSDSGMSEEACAQLVTQMSDALSRVSGESYMVAPSGAAGSQSLPASTETSPAASAPAPARSARSVSFGSVESIASSDASMINPNLASAQHWLRTSQASEASESGDTITRMFARGNAEREGQSGEEYPVSEAGVPPSGERRSRSRSVSARRIVVGGQLRMIQGAVSTMGDRPRHAVSSSSTAEAAPMNSADAAATEPAATEDGAAENTNNEP
jgi:hypothetical protein